MHSIQRPLEEPEVLFTDDSSQDSDGVPRDPRKWRGLGPKTRKGLRQFRNFTGVFPPPEAEQHWSFICLQPLSFDFNFFNIPFVCIQQFRRVTSIGSQPPKTLGKSHGPPQSPAETPQNPRRDPAEPSERPPQSPLRGKFPRRASRRVVPLGWWPSGTLEVQPDGTNLQAQSESTTTRVSRNPTFAQSKRPG